MRVSTTLFFRQGQQAISSLQNGLARTQMQLASGQRLLDAADDPVAAARLLDIDAAVARTTQYERNANMARGRLSLEEQTLTDVGDVLFRVRDLLLQAGISASLITIAGRGEREPVVPTADEVPQAENRRVEINLR